MNSDNFYIILDCHARKKLKEFYEITKKEKIA